ncbi:class I SAM-dependent methyltransferase [Halothiobacillus sp. DCM-1]|uniref:class I SAM-dependent methyltransferase n=1 Tax=Halothiobacillus sp. DCM-1 TaxID=3112558 RepID=UPI0032430A2B
MSDFWNQKYAREDYFYGEQPNDFLRSQAFRLPPAARILVIGDGEGRNGVWLAQQGFDVSTVDYSAVACQKARALAARRGVMLDSHCADLLTWDWPVAAFDAVVSIFLHFEPSDRQQIHQRIAHSLRPQGLLIVELFHPNQLNYRSGGPKAVEMLVTADDLRADWPQLDWLLLVEGETRLTEGVGHEGTGWVTHGVARRSA